MNIRLLILMVGWGMLAAMPAHAGTAHATGHASAEVRERLAILARTPLIFGYILPGSSAGTVTVTPLNQRYASGHVQLVPSAYDRATFVVRGNPHRFYSIYAPQTLTVTSTGPLPVRNQTNILQARDFTTYSQNLHATGSTGRLDFVGLDWVYMGATLVVPANVAPGLYSARVPLTVAY